jgi:hypothetical protein
MEYSLRRKKLVRALIAILVIVLVLIGFKVWYSSKFHITKTDPDLKQFSNIVPFLDVYFNMTLDSSGLNIVSSPKIINSYKIKGNVLDLSLSRLAQNHKYTITINSIRSTNNKFISNKTLTFTTKYISPKDLTTDQRSAILKNQDHYNSPSNDPIVAHLPYSNLNFSLSDELTTSTSSGRLGLVLNAQILISPGVTGAQANTDIAQYESDVRSYISSFGLDPSKYTINYQVTYEELTGILGN